MAQPKRQTPHVTIWDTMAPLGQAIDVRNKHRWQTVPADLLTLELNPAAAMSDPSHYGRAYAFQGDAVVENNLLVAAFSANQGKIVIYSKRDSKTSIELVPLQLKDKPAKITHCSILQNTGDEATLEISFSATSSKSNLKTLFSLDPTDIVTIKPTANMKGVSLKSHIAYGVIPSFIGDDLVFDPQQYPSLNSIHLPNENLFLGLLKGYDNMLVVTWPKGQQAISASLNNEQRLIQSVDLTNDGKNLYIALLNAPGLWHKETLQRSYLERDITLSWTRPFPAKWKTQLIEGRTKTTFVFKESKQNIWRGEVGSYTYPVRFDGDAAIYRLSKKIPPKGESIVYFTERQDTPLSISTPVDIMKESLGRETYDRILDIRSRQLRTHHRRGAEGIRRACTCGCTEAIEKVFKAGQEVDQKKYVEDAVEDMVYFVTRHVERINEYQAFAANLIKLLERSSKSTVTTKPFVNSMVTIAKELQAEYSRAKEHMKTLAFTDQLARKTKDLAQDKRPKNLEACLALCKQWRAMGGAQDDVLAQSHRITRKLYNEAGYQAAENPKTVEIARRIREMCKKCLGNPDGYEIWPDY